MLTDMGNALFVAWRSRGQEPYSWGPVGRLDYNGKYYRFIYTKGARKLKGFQPFPKMEDMNRVYESESLFPLFANRLLPPSRPEYEAFLRWGGFSPDNPPDPIAILGVTEGRRVTDAVELFPCPIPDSDGCYLNKFFLHGIRWMHPAAIERIATLRAGEALYLMPDIANPYDRDAVAVRTGDADGRLMIGYAPRYLAYDVRELSMGCEPDFISLTVERVNPDAPLQHRLLCRMRSCWPEDFRPCSSDEFEPLVEPAPYISR